ncbi:MAG: glycosyltransferase family 9 protein [Bacteroidales bacterium]|jgi:ADP-heptose:LPS heptosyltransferase|nr:glycosyltransferase family 9 protein [Bacteroidales bacterium]
MHLLVIRTSAMGDVALTTPVIRGFRSQYPDVKLTVVTRSTYEQFFYSIKDCDLFFSDFKKRHSGFFGILRLYRDLKRKGRIDRVIDLHDVLRTKILRLFFRMTGIPCDVIDKGRKEKREIIKGRSRIRLKHSVERFCDVFANAGFPVEPADTPCILHSAEALSEVSGLQFNMDDLNIGVAPYTRHAIKTWPEEKILKLLKLISAERNIKVWLFGGFGEKQKLEKFATQFPDSYVVTGTMSLAGELALMGRLDMMISMDSSNMHMAALVGTRVISIWGATDPLSGFSAWQQPDENAIRIPVGELGCRPCTVFGKGTCRRKDLACMNWLTPEKVFERLVNLKII